MKAFETIGTQKSTIGVRISYRIIELFSDGLYTSPNKAIEELVSNAYDAGATLVHVILPQDFQEPDATIVTIDNGIGMDEDTFKEHWIIGISKKREVGAPRERKPIGKFGIGKLATFVLAKKFTHISKRNGMYFAATMDYSRIPRGGSVSDSEQIELPFRELTEEEAIKAVQEWTQGDKPGYTSLNLFGTNPSPTWTVAIMSDLKDMAKQHLRRGRLKWVLSNAMPLRDDFALYLNGDRAQPTKIDRPKINTWILGSDLQKLPKPASPDFEPVEDATASPDSYLRYGLTHPELGRVTGYAELFEDSLIPPDSQERIDRSHGFFVYVFGRLINFDDEYFGIPRNLLRHGTFSRFRAVVNINTLDKELRSSRESIRDGTLVNCARDLLQGLFNYARTAHQTHADEEDPSRQLSRRVAGTPTSLSRKPILTVVRHFLYDGILPKYLRLPQNLDRDGKEAFLDSLSKKIDSAEFVRAANLVELGVDQGIALYDTDTGTLEINLLHPFVAHFLEAYEDRRRNLPLELLAMSEVLLEGQMLEQGIAHGQALDLLERRDRLLRYLAKAGGKRNAFLIAQDLMDAATSESGLEEQLVAAFDSMGFDAVPVGGRDRPDGYAQAHLAAKDGKEQRYSVSLEAKSVKKQGKRVSAQSVDIAAVARHRDGYNCQHAIVVAPEFQDSHGDQSAVIESAKKDKEHNDELKTITLMRINDLAKLVRIVPLKRIGLETIRDLFRSCISADEASSWVHAQENKTTTPISYKMILDTLYEIQEKEPDHIVQYGSLRTALRMKHDVTFLDQSLFDISKALSKMAPEYVFANESTVELVQRPDVILAAIRATVDQYPDSEQHLFTDRL